MRHVLCKHSLVLPLMSVPNKAVSKETGLAIELLGCVFAEWQTTITVLSKDSIVRYFGLGLQVFWTVSSQLRMKTALLSKTRCGASSSISPQQKVLHSVWAMSSRFMTPVLEIGLHETRSPDFRLGHLLIRQLVDKAGHFTPHGDGTHHPQWDTLLSLSFIATSKLSGNEFTIESKWENMLVRCSRFRLCRRGNRRGIKKPTI